MIYLRRLYKVQLKRRYIDYPCIQGSVHLYPDHPTQSFHIS